MVLVNFYCYSCSNQFSDSVDYDGDAYIPPKELLKNITCPICEVSDHKVLGTKTNVMVDHTLGYFDQSLGTYIGSSSDKRRILKEMGKVEVGTRKDAESHNRALYDSKKRSLKEKKEKVLVEGVKRTNARFGIN